MAFLASSAIAAIHMQDRYRTEMQEWIDYGDADDVETCADLLSQSAPQLGRGEGAGAAVRLDELSQISGLVRLAGIPQSTALRTAWGSFRKDVEAPASNSLAAFQESFDDDWGQEFELPDYSDPEAPPALLNETPLSTSSSSLALARPQATTKSSSRSRESRESLPASDFSEPRSVLLSRSNSFKETSNNGMNIGESGHGAKSLLGDLDSLYDPSSKQGLSRMSLVQSSAGVKVLNVHQVAPSTLVLESSPDKRRSRRASAVQPDDWSLDFDESVRLSCSLGGERPLSRLALPKQPSSSSLKSSHNSSPRKGILVKRTSFADSLSDAFETDSDVSAVAPNIGRERSESSATLAEPQSVLSISSSSFIRAASRELATIAELDECGRTYVRQELGSAPSISPASQDPLSLPTTQNTANAGHSVELALPHQSSRVVFPDSLELSDGDPVSTGTGPLEVSHPRLDRVQFGSNLRRLLASPCPSLGTSILGSDGEGDAGIEDDIEFPDSLEVLLAGPLKNRRDQERAPLNNGIGRLGVVQVAGRMGTEDEEDDDPMGGLDIPADKVLEIKVTAISPAEFHKHMQGLGATRGGGGSIRDNGVYRVSGGSASRGVMHGNVAESSTAGNPLTPQKPHMGSKIISTRATTPSASQHIRLPMIQPAKKALVTKKTYGDGTELDGIEGFDVREMARSSAGSPAPAGRIHATKNSGAPSTGKKMELPKGRTTATPGPKALQPFPLRTPPGKKSGQNKLAKKPTLIAQMGKSTNKIMAMHSASTSMIWNPTLSKWDGNEDDLRDFDVPSPTRPALISNLGLPGATSATTGTAGGSVVVGKMTFDPIKMRWVGNERDVDDVFGEWDEDDGGSTRGDVVAGPSKHDFDVGTGIRDHLARAEDAHRSFMSRWYLKGATESVKGGAQRSIPRNYMYDIFR
ncbi:hypothetical protein HDU93_000252 [Gonapodya sp. JEL0774]|nr:hypothetical protein HDU93_000252 [Gonapodya sp. JEL0774]